MRLTPIHMMILVFSTTVLHVPAVAGEPLPVVVSIVPQKYFVERIGGELVDVHVIVPPGADPHTYEPRPRQMAAVSRAKLYFAIGIAFEEVKLAKVIAANPGIRLVRTDAGIEKMPLPADPHGGLGSDAAQAGSHRGEGPLDPHIWLSPPLVMIQARTILEALQAADPANRSRYAENHAAFASGLSALDADLREVFRDRQGLRFLVFHPSWGYFAHSYGLRQIPVEVEGKNPKPAQLKALIEYARENRIRVVFAQPRSSAKSAELVARAIGGQVVLVDPLAENWMENLREVAGKFQTALN